MRVIRQDVGCTSHNHIEHCLNNIRKFPSPDHDEHDECLRPELWNGVQQNQPCDTFSNFPAGQTSARIEMYGYNYKFSAQ